jgi:glucokinase
MADPLFLGIEIGGTKLQLGLGRGDGRLLAFRRLEVEPAAGSARIREQIAGAVGPLLSELGEKRRSLAAVGVGFGGPVDARRGVVTESYQVGGWSGFPLTDWLRGDLGVAVVAVQNDADTAGLGEARFGAGVGLSPVLYVTIGSGIGGGLILDGSIYRGAGAGAVEIGHLWIVDDEEGEPRARELEAMASGWAIGVEARHAVDRQVAEGAGLGPLGRLVGGDSLRMTAALAAEAARLGDPDACQVFRRAARAMARALAHAVTLLAPRRVVLGGGVSLAPAELWIDPIREGLNSLVFRPFRGTFDVVPAALGEEVVVHGALALARDAHALGVQ